MARARNGSYGGAHLVTWGLHGRILKGNIEQRQRHQVLHH